MAQKRLKIKCPDCKKSFWMTVIQLCNVKWDPCEVEESIVCNFCYCIFDWSEVKGPSNIEKLGEKNEKNF